MAMIFVPIILKISLPNLALVDLIPNWLNSQKEIDNLLQKGLIKPSNIMVAVSLMLITQPIFGAFDLSRKNDSYSIHLLNLHQNSPILLPIRRIVRLRKFKLHFPILQEFISRDLVRYMTCKKDHKSLTNSLTDLVKTIKERVKSLPCLTLANPRLAKDCRDGRCLIWVMEKTDLSRKKYATSL
ncbi:hypothetical protein H5410_064218 [Solanum commersonii]|uniref:Uncharacterized protein n=1 Tax=Solanum commersonii TaxID=4109 RepID=A0A9J5W067_SOLCO|nr:hypothetical protein H5410_064218 [Solanum commersonii]